MIIIFLDISTAILLSLRHRCGFLEVLVRRRQATVPTYSESARRGPFHPPSGC